MHRFIKIGVGAMFLCVTAVSYAAWPQKPIKLVVPYAPGGSTDTIARKYANYIQQILKQPIVIDNKPGASTNIGSDHVVRAQPDGYTFLWGIDTLATNPSVGPAPSFDPQKDLEPVGMVTRIPGLIAANSNFEAKSIEDLMSKAKSNPGKYSISSASLFLQVALVEKYTGMSLMHVPYKGGAQAAMDAVGGQVNLVFANIPVLKPLVAGGKLNPIAVTSATRSVALPDVPTLVEIGMSDAVITNWYALFAPKGTPADIVDKLSKVTEQFVNDPQMKAELEPQGFQLVSSTPEELQTILKQDTDNIAKFVQANPNLVRKN